MEESKLEKNRIKYIILEIVDEILSNSNPDERQENIISLLLSLGYKVTKNKKFRIVGLIVGSLFMLGEKKIKQLFYLMAAALLVIVGFNIYLMIDSKGNSVNIDNSPEIVSNDSLDLREISFFCDYPFYDSLFVLGVRIFQRNEFPDRTRSLSGQDLSGARLDNMNFSFTRFIQTNLSGSSITNSDFRNSIFMGANLSNCNLNNSFLSSSDAYERAELNGISLNNAKTYEKNWIQNLAALINPPSGINEIEDRYFVDGNTPFKEYDWIDDEIYYLIKEK